MIGAVLLTQVPDAISFSGGAADRFVEEMARLRAAPVAVFANPDDRFAAFSDLPRSGMDAANLAKRSGLLAYGDTLGFSSRKLPPGFLVRAFYSDYVRSFGRRTKPTYKNGRITIPSAGSKWMLVNDLTALPLKRRLELHWTYASAFVAVSPGTFDELKLLQTVGDALGARVQIEKEAIAFNFDAAKHRRRAAACYADEARLNRLGGDFVWKASLYRSGVSTFNDDEWAIAYDNPDSALTNPSLPSSSPFIQEARQALTRLLNHLRETNQTQTYANVLESSRKLDGKATGSLTIRADGAVAAELILNDGLGRLRF